MAKDYGKRNSARHRGGASKQLLLSLMCFLLGYLSASVFDFTSLSNWVNTHILAQHTTPAAIKPAPLQAQLPKPKFEFYTLLASEHKDPIVPVVTAAPVAVATTTTIPSGLPAKNSPVAVPLSNVAPVKQSPNQVVTSKDAYLVQIAAFKSKPEAEKMKASLTLKGFMVNIAIVNQQNTSWYRVSIGPFSSRTQALQAQGAVARSEHIIGMIRKMDA